MTFNNIFNFGFSPSIKETYFEQFLAFIFSFASSFTRTSQSLFPSLYGTDNFLALVSFPLSSVLCVVFVVAEEEEEEEEEEEDDDDDGITCFLLTMIFLDDDDTRRFVVPFNNEGEEEGEGEYEYSNLVVVVVILLVVKLVVIVPQKARVIKTFCVCVFLCLCVEDKVLLLFFPPFAKSRTDGRKRKFSFVGKKI